MIGDRACGPRCGPRGQRPPATACPRAGGYSRNIATRPVPALPPLNVTNKVSRYISWPGQALAYKTGEILIRRLRADGEARLGDRFDLADFHDTILEEGPLPLPNLEEKMEAWIAAQEG
ncbi:MAG: DUF885 family protein [Glycocaulis sp.]